MIVLTVEEITALHAKLIERTGGSHGLRDQSLLESAVYSALSAFGDREVYPTVEEKAARLMFALTNNHAFVDGNKRIGVFTMLMTLQLNSISLHYTQGELVSLGLLVAAGEMDYESKLAWILEHKI